MFSALTYGAHHRRPQPPLYLVLLDQGWRKRGRRIAKWCCDLSCRRVLMGAGDLELDINGISCWPVAPNTFAISIYALQTPSLVAPIPTLSREAATLSNILTRYSSRIKHREARHSSPRLSHTRQDVQKSWMRRWYMRKYTYKNCINLTCPSLIPALPLV